MSEYTLIKDITTYTRRNPFIHPNDEPIYHDKWIKKWESLLLDIKNKPDAVGIEIGTNYGGFFTWCLDSILTNPTSHLYTIDINSNIYIENNIKPYKNVTFIKNLSHKALRNLSHNNQDELFADFVYIDGGHFSKYVIEDAVLSFPLLKYNGIMAFDDYHWGIHTTDETVKPKNGIDAFLKAYVGHYQIIEIGWQVYLRKIKCNYPIQEIEGNIGIGNKYE